MQLNLRQIGLLFPVEMENHKASKGFARIGHVKAGEVGLVFSDDTLHYVDITGNVNMELVIKKPDCIGGHVYFNKDGTFHSYCCVMPFSFDYSKIQKKAVKPKTKLTLVSVNPMKQEK